MRILVCLSGEAGGTDLLLLKYVNWLKDNKELVDTIVIGNGKWSDFHMEYDLVVLPTSQISNLITLKNHGIKFKKVFVWAMGHGAFRAAFYNTTINKNSILNKIYISVFDRLSNITIKQFLKLDSCIFTDEVGMNFDIKNTGIEPVNAIFPIPIRCSDQFLNRYKESKIIDNIKFCWVGRISKDFKVYSLIRLIEDIEDNIKNGIIINKINFTIVGSGDGDKLLEQTINNTQFIKFNRIPFVKYDDLNQLISEQADILFAMGTSALDGAKIGCPTVIIQPQPDYCSKPCDNYRWVFESKGFSLGEFNYDNIKPKQIAKSFNQIYNDILVDSKLSEKSYHYATRFEEDKIFYDLLNRQLPKNLNIRCYIMIFILYIIKLTKKLLKALLMKVKH